MTNVQETRCLVVPIRRVPIPQDLIQRGLGNSSFLFFETNT